MAVDLQKLLSVVEAASHVFRAAMEVAGDAAMAADPTVDQVELKARLMALREQNEQGFERLQGKLEAIIAAGESAD
jgi:hypothetical protein